MQIILSTLLHDWRCSKFVSTSITTNTRVMYDVLLIPWLYWHQMLGLYYLLMGLPLYISMYVHDSMWIF